MVIGVNHVISTLWFTKQKRASSWHMSKQREDKRGPLEKRASGWALFSISLLILNTDSGPAGHGNFREIVNWKKSLNDRLCLKAVVLFFFRENKNF